MPSDEDKEPEEDASLARIQRRAEMAPSDDEESSEDGADDADDVARTRRRAELMPSDEDEDSDASSDNENDIARMARRAELMPSDEDDDSDDYQHMPVNSGNNGKPSGVGSVNDDEDDDESSDDNSEDDDDDEPGVTYKGISGSDDDDESDDSGSDEDEAERLRRARKKPIREITLADRLALKLDGSEGAKPWRRRPLAKPVVTAWAGGDSSREDGPWEESSRAPAEEQEPEHQEPKKSERKKRKGAPMEMSTKWAVGRHRDVVGVKKPKRMDPRFLDALMGGGGNGAQKGYDAEMLQFLNDKRAKELKALEHAIKKEKRRRGGRASASADTKIEVLKQAAARLKQAQGEQKRAQLEKSALAEWRKTERVKVAAGKQPFFLKRAAAKELVLNKRFEDLTKGKGGKKRGEKYLERKQKKQASKERKRLPHERGGSNAAGF